MKSRKQFETMLDLIHGGQADILVGTQMLAKGHDFPKLTLGGALGADAALYAADWRAPDVCLPSSCRSPGGPDGPS